MKKIMLLSFLLVAALFVNAQSDKGNSAVKAEKKATKLADQLGLSVDQQAALQTIFAEQQENRKLSRKEMRNLSTEERAAIKEERKGAKAAFDERIATVLTPEQYEAYQNLPKKGRGKGGANKGKGKGKGKGGANKEKGKGKSGANKGKGKSKKSPEERAQKRVDSMTEKLNLSEDQQAQIYTLLVEQAAPNGQVPNWKDLSKEEKEAYRAQRKADKEAYKIALTEILTPAQLATYEELEGHDDDDDNDDDDEKGKKGKKGKKGNKGNKF